MREKRNITYHSCCVRQWLRQVILPHPYDKEVHLRGIRDVYNRATTLRKGKDYSLFSRIMSMKATPWELFSRENFCGFEMVKCLLGPIQRPKRGFVYIVGIQKQQAYERRRISHTWRQIKDKANQSPI